MICEAPLQATGNPPRFPLTPTDGFVLSRVDGSLTAEQIVSLTPLPEPVARQSLERLLEAGAIEARPKPASRAGGQILAMLEHIKGKNHYAVLGVPSSASHEEITAAYLAAMRRFHPDSFRASNDPEVLLAVRTIFARVERAYEILGHRESRARYDGPAPTIAGPH